MYFLGVSWLKKLYMLHLLNRWGGAQRYKDFLFWSLSDVHFFPSIDRILNRIIDKPHTSSIKDKSGIEKMIHVLEKNTIVNIQLFS